MEILIKLFSLVEEGKFTNPIKEGEDNKEHILNFLTDALFSSYPNVNKVHIQTSILNLFTRCNIREKFIETTVDLLVSLKEVSDTNDEFFIRMKEVSLL